MRLSILAVAVFAAAVAASPTYTSPHVLHEKREGTLRWWSKRGPAPADLVLPFRIGLVQSNLDKGEDLLYEVSDMNSPKYGQHYTPEEIIELFAPPPAAVDTVRNWLQSAGIKGERIGQSVNKQWMMFEASVAEAESLFKTKYHKYLHSGTGNENIGCDEYHLPQHVQPYVDYVTPGLKMLAGRSRPEKRKSDMAAIMKRGFRDGSGAFSGPAIIEPLGPSRELVANNPTAHCDIAATPQCIAKLYNITKPTTAYKGNELGIFEEGDFYRAGDMDQFYQNFAPQIPTGTYPTLEGIDGGYAPMATAGGESNLDLQVSYPIIYPQKNILFQTDDINYSEGTIPTDGFLNTFFDAIDGSYCTYSAYGETGDSPTLDPKYPDPAPGGYDHPRQCGVYKPTHVISISYGEQEDDLPAYYQRRQCNEVMKLAMQGTTIVVSSGDSGVAARGEDNGHPNGCLGNGEVFNPDFPTNCPYIVSAGATYLPIGSDVNKDQEVAVTRFPSGGGFSNIYPRPAYQNQAVQNYFNHYVPPYKYYNLSTPNSNPSEAMTKGGRYNRLGRGYPDMSAIGDNVVIILNSVPTLIGGTSASAPAIAAIFNRINEERLAVGKSTIGFVHPTLYAHPEMFHDITVGNNSGCGTEGFVASKGWDPVTGLGTPNYPKMLQVFLNAR